MNKPSKNYEEIKYTPGLYWAKGVVPNFETKERPWILLRVMEPMWTKESGNTHCLWYYEDSSGEGKEIDCGEWILVEDPNEL